ncbi:hypothetical protein NGK36_17045 [Hafnia alvei]|uniref:DnaT-like ssDNA-binding protein n=1 Tax=Hafnia alvei TaxID=569 RepID=UPI002DB99593|nr:DnaT-like ssDNA-binding protein [Hafnia alvei]MEB7890979.1 hypothetical protein [Hafnia alvei]
MLVTDPTSPDFNSYASADDLAKYAEGRDLELPEKTEPLLIKAMDYLTGLNWQGQRTNDEQPLAWPRSNVVFDGRLYPKDKIPRELVTAQCMLAIEAKEGDLLASNREAAIKRERIEGAIDTTYAIADGESFKPSYPAVDSMLREFTTSTFEANAIARRA